MSSRRGGWDYPYNEPSGSWDQQLGALQDQWPDMLKQRSEREREIATRTTEQQLQNTTQMLDSWSSNLDHARQLPQPPPPAPSHLNQLPYAAQRPSLHQSARPQPWNGGNWQQHRQDSVGDGLRSASGMVATTFSPTEPHHRHLPRNASVSSSSSSQATPYSPYVIPRHSLDSSSRAVPPPNGQWDAQGAPTPGHFEPIYQPTDSYHSDSSPAPTSVHSPYEQSYPSPYAFEHQGPFYMQPSAAPHPSLFVPPPHHSQFAVDEQGRSISAPWPPYPPPSLYNQSTTYPVPPPHSSFALPTFYGQPYPSYEPYSVGALAGHSSNSHSPEDLRSSEYPPQVASTHEGASPADPVPVAVSDSPLAPVVRPPTEAAVSELLPAASTSTNVDFAAANKALLAQSKSTTAKRSKVTKKNPAHDEAGDETEGAKPARRVSQTRPVPRKGSKRVAVDLHIDCEVCSKALARLILRGAQEDFDVAYTPSFKCIECDQAEKAADQLEDAEEANPEAEQSVRPRSTKSTKTAFTSFRKRHKRSDTQSAVNACDVCLRDVTVGSIFADNQQERIEFHVEVVCTSCDIRYRRCSDCGGGGGARLGVGKWRSHELFVGDRKTCSLPHVRLGALSDMFYDVHSVTEIPPNEVDEIAEICGAIFSNTLYSGICIPEVFEHQSAIAKNFADVQVMASRGWGAITPMIKVDIEQQRGIRRYLGLRSCAPNPRKGAHAAPRPPDNPNKIILRPKKDVVGFIVSEWDASLPLMINGCLFLAVVVPWAMGEVFDATTILIQAIFQRIEEDRRKLNAERASSALPPLPPVDLVWTMMFFQKDSRMIGHLEKKRGFEHLPDFLKSHRDVDPKLFPPLRPCYLPVERQAGWQVMVRRRDGPSDDFFAIRRTSTSEGIEKKVKEKKARARRAEEAAAEGE